MKKNKFVVDLCLLLGLTVLTFISIAPKVIIMPSAVEMALLLVVTVLLVGFLLLFWRENPADEREVENQASASRSAYIVGSLVLVVALVWQSFSHDVDPFIPLTLLVMIATKLVVQRRKDDK
jgi:nicotinamide riboside transporter PnuC